MFADDGVAMRDTYASRYRRLLRRRRMPKGRLVYRVWRDEESDFAFYGRIFLLRLRASPEIRQRDFAHRALPGLESATPMPLLFGAMPPLCRATFEARRIYRVAAPPCH